MSKTCVTHHAACDCREAEFAKMKAELASVKIQLLGSHDVNIILMERLNKSEDKNEKLKTALKERKEENELLKITMHTDDDRALELAIKNDMLTQILKVIATGLVQGESTAHFAGLKPKEIARKALEQT
jgi:hypothetical protein